MRFCDLRPGDVLIDELSTVCWLLVSKDAEGRNTWLCLTTGKIVAEGMPPDKDLVPSQWQVIVLDEQEL